jgi:hypothetical protein
MLTIVKATELDGVTLKDGDVGEKLERTGVDKRFGLILIPEQQSVKNIEVGHRLVAYDPDKEEYLRTSSIKEVNINPVTDQLEVVTRNTIYFIEDVPN